MLPLKVQPSKRFKGESKMNNHGIEKEIKLSKLGDRLLNEGIICHHDRKRLSVDRQTLKEFISGTLNISDAHTVNGWIDYLVNIKWFEHNPDSQKSLHGFIKPSNDTRYFINFDKIAHTHIDQYGNTNSASPEHQETTKDKPFSLKSP